MPIYTIKMEYDIFNAKYKIGDKVRYKGTKMIGKIIDVKPFTEKSFCYLVKYTIFMKKWAMEDSLELIMKLKQNYFFDTKINGEDMKPITFKTIHKGYGRKVHEMKYIGEKLKGGIQILEEGTCFGFQYYIISFGSHPCCYVEIPKVHSCYGLEYDEIEIACHGGLTFSNDKLFGIDSTGLKWFIGWDFAHHGDYFYANDKFEIEGHKWTLAELQDQVFKVCKQLRDLY